MERHTHLLEAYDRLCALSRAKTEAMEHILYADELIPGALYVPTEAIGFEACTALVEAGKIERDKNAPMAAFRLVRS